VPVSTTAPPRPALAKKLSWAALICGLLSVLLPIVPYYRYFGIAPFPVTLTVLAVSLPLIAIGGGTIQLMIPSWRNGALNLAAIASGIMAITIIAFIIANIADC